MKFAKKTDALIIVMLLVLCVAAFIFYRQKFGAKVANAEIYYGSELIKTVVLKAGKDETFTLKQNENVVFHVESDGSICFLQSDCPDKVCIRAGKLRTVGETAACLPNKMIVKLVPADGKWGKDADIVV